MKFHPVIELELLVALDSEKAGIVLSDSNILTLKRLLRFIEITAHVGWQLLHKRVEEPGVADWVCLIGELPDTLLQRQAEFPSDAVRRSLDLDNAGPRV